ncbi:MAG: translation elongation factor Ts [candidate division KSB1 bacterium]|nr:translation elongation factor Ts [candidate division KSB1 bacterium]MDZ7275027.1 translation elongation factor Ts [candidate division KSB1 bacterium]MDZ7286524.1 translation elongation factor Ts [candidate division KSB1 bacterium]MDZ7299312.1 translation elongation factor Ts [candidate division KSB1 bacterium]MDZ7306983.1 translation elongation factor Ts [candidate division KSB1 bacterium]
MAVSAEAVKQLREQTGAGIMDCKHALAESGGDIEKAIEWLRKKGAATADTKKGRATNEGVIEAYIHPGSRLGVLVEVNCETDFVAKTEAFRTLVRDIAMQIAASNPKVVAREQMPAELIEKELEIYRSQAQNEKKPANVVERIAQGKLEKFYQDNVLLEQSFIKDPNRTISQVIAETIGKLGENITVRRFVRFQLGE